MGEAAVYCEAGYCDYVLFGKDGSPMAVVEAHQQGSECWSETGYAVCGLFRAEVWPQTDDVYDEWI